MKKKGIFHEWIAFIWAHGSNVGRTERTLSIASLHKKCCHVYFSLAAEHFYGRYFMYPLLYVQAALFDSARPCFTCKRKHEIRLHGACAVLHTETTDRFNRGSKMSWISGNDKGYDLIQMEHRKNYQKDFHTNHLGSRGLSKLRVKDNYVTVFNYINIANEQCSIIFITIIWGPFKTFVEAYFDLMLKKRRHPLSLLIETYDLFFSKKLHLFYFFLFSITEYFSLR